MAYLLKLSSFLLKVGVFADREATPETKALTFYERDFAATGQVDKVQRATTIKSFFVILLVSLFLFTFLGCVIARRNNRRLLNNGNVEGDQPDEEANPGNDEHVVLLQNRFEIEENRTNTEDHDRAHHRQHSLFTLEEKFNFGTRLAIANFLVEIPPAVLNQMASGGNHDYVLAVMLITLTSVLVCLVKLVYKGRRERIAWRRGSGRIPWGWFYYPSPRSNRPFGTLPEIIGLVCAMVQSIISVINYIFCLLDDNTPVKVCVWPAIFAFGLLCSRFMGGESRSSGEDEGDVALDRAILEPSTPAEMLQ